MAFLSIQLNFSAKSLCYLSRISLNFLVKHIIMDVSYLVATTTRPSRQSAIILVSIDNFLSQSVNNGFKYILQRVWDRMLNTQFHKMEQLILATMSQFSGAWNIFEMKSAMHIMHTTFSSMLSCFYSYFFGYHTCAIIGRSQFEAALVYKPRILSLKNEEFPFLVHKLSAI